MGRWGHRLVEADHGISIALEVIQDLYKGDEVAWLINDTLKDALQAKLDSGSGEQLLKKYRLDEGGRGSFAARDNRYKFIMFGAMMMLVGASIKDDDVGHLRELVPVVECDKLFTNMTEGMNASAALEKTDCQKSYWSTLKRGGCGPPMGQGTAVFRAYGKTTTAICLYDGAQI
ncbi:hypothetical protein DL769_006268 [Monosporascus sp. CRB-8-3]|nr:hypothetical protein DL769_006268 [Monosporascus sp. CRB-8-3]